MLRTQIKSGRAALQRALADARHGAKLSQAELAARLGKPQSFVSKIESGERRLDLVEAMLVADALGVRFADLADPVRKAMARSRRAR